jgi:hypothetical protein
VKLLGIGVQGIRAEKNGEISDEVADHKKHQQNAGDGYDGFLSYGRKNPQVRRAWTGSCGRGG